MFNKIFFYASSLLFHQLIYAQVNLNDLKTEFSNITLSIGYVYSTPSIYTSAFDDNPYQINSRHCLITNHG